MGSTSRVKVGCSGTVPSFAAETDGPTATHTSNTPKNAADVSEAFIVSLNASFF